MRRAAIIAFGATASGAAAGPAMAQAASPGVDPAHTAWMLTATALVLLMTLPGLALFYAGLVRLKNVLSVMAHCVAIACLALVPVRPLIAGGPVPTTPPHAR